MKPHSLRGWVCDTNLSDFADHVFIRPTGVLLQGIGKTPFELTFRKKQKGRAVPLYQMTWYELTIYKDLLTNISTGTIGTAMTYSCFLFFSVPCSNRTCSINASVHQRCRTRVIDGLGCADQEKAIMKIHTPRHVQWYCACLSLNCFS